MWDNLTVLLWRARRRLIVNYWLMFSRNLLTAGDVEAKTSTGNWPVSFLVLFFISFGEARLIFYTRITFLAILLEDTITGGAYFDSTSRCFHMFPKRMKGRGSSSQTCIRHNWDLEANQIRPWYCFPPQRALHTLKVTQLGFISRGRIWLVGSMRGLINSLCCDKKRELDSKINITQKRSVFSTCLFVLSWIGLLFKTISGNMTFLVDCDWQRGIIKLFH